MFAKRFMFVSAGVLLLVAAFEIGARMAGAQNVVTYQETAVLSGEVADGGTIPLPHYRDGSEALESECTWIVSPKTTTVGEDAGYPNFQRCSTEGRLVRVYWCRSGCSTNNVFIDCGMSNPCFGPRAGTANYLVIAVRSDTPTPAQKASWGKVKASYR